MHSLTVGCEKKEQSPKFRKYRRKENKMAGNIGYLHCQEKEPACAIG
jgi:hypothetical protein